MANKELIVVGGPNGAGKSTFVAKYLSQRPCTYLCADLIATEFPHLDPLSQQIEAGREFLRRLEEQLGKQENFIVESTLSGRTLRHFLQRAQTIGFTITVFFIYLDSADSCVARVRARVRRGGHDVPKADIHRRYARSLANFWRIYRKIADQWTLLYNAGNELVEVAFGVGIEVEIVDVTQFHLFLAVAESEDHGQHFDPR